MGEKGWRYTWQQAYVALTSLPGLEFSRGEGRISLTFSILLTLAWTPWNLFIGRTRYLSSGLICRWVGSHVFWCLVSGRTPSLTHLIFPSFLQPPALQDHNGFLWGSQDMGSRQPSLCPQSWLGWTLLRPGSTSCARPRGSRIWWAGSGSPPSIPIVSLGRGCYLQLGLEDHNKDGEGNTHCHTVRQAQEEGGEEAHHPDTL